MSSPSRPDRGEPTHHPHELGPLLDNVGQAGSSSDILHHPVGQPQDSAEFALDDQHLPRPVLPPPPDQSVTLDLAAQDGTTPPSPSTLSLPVLDHSGEVDEHGRPAVNVLAPQLAAELDAALLLHHQAAPTDFHHHHLDHHDEHSPYDQNHEQQPHENGHNGMFGDGHDQHAVEHVSGLVEAFQAFTPNGGYAAYDDAGHTNAVASGSGSQPKPVARKKTKLSTETTENGDDGKRTATPKRQQVKNACSNCQKSRKKCTGERPCQNCSKAGTEISCVDSERKPRPKGLRRGPYKKKNRLPEETAAASLQISTAEYQIYQHQLSLHGHPDPLHLHSDVAPHSQDAHHDGHHSPHLDAFGQPHTAGETRAYYDQPLIDDPARATAGATKPRRREKGEAVGRLSEAMIEDEAEGDRVGVSVCVGVGPEGGEQERAYQMGQRELGVLDPQLFPPHHHHHHHHHHQPDDHHHPSDDAHQSAHHHEPEEHHDPELFARQLAQVNGEDHLAAGEPAEIKEAPQEGLLVAGVDTEEQAQEYEMEAQLAGE